MDTSASSDDLFRTHEIDIQTPPNKLIAGCLNAWRGWQNNDQIPRWTGSEMLMDIPSTILPYTNIVDVQLEPRDFIFRYWGSGYLNSMGRELTGQSCRAIKPLAFAENVEQMYEEVCRRKTPVLYAGHFINKIEMDAEEFVLRMPLSKDDTTVDMIMSNIWIDPTEARKWIHKDDETF